MWITFLNYPKKTYKNIYFLLISIMIVPKMRKIVIQSVDNFYGIYLFLSFYYDESVRLGYDFFATLALRSP